MPRKTAKKPPDIADVTVFVPRGQVRADDIHKAALLAARDLIPPGAHNVKHNITSVSEPITSNGTEGRDYRITITWTPRTGAATGDEHGTVDEVLNTLEPLTPAKLAKALHGGAEEPEE